MLILLSYSQSSFIKNGNPNHEIAILDTDTYDEYCRNSMLLYELIVCLLFENCLTQFAPACQFIEAAVLITP